MEEYSVLMSVYEKENPVFFRNSIESMMKQSLPFSDFVLVCDGPLGKELEEIVQWAESCLGERFQCIRLPENRGLGKALAEGITHCRHDIVARMDSDDLSRPERCRLQMEGKRPEIRDTSGFPRSIRRKSAFMQGNEIRLITPA